MSLRKFSHTFLSRYLKLMISSSMHLYYLVYTIYNVEIYIFILNFKFIAVLQIGQIQAVSERLVNACTFDG